MQKVGFDINRQLYSAFLVRCHEEGLNPDDVLTKWMERALRQKRTIIPMTEPGDEANAKTENGDENEAPEGRVVRLRKQHKMA